jgi:hypothetical protein
LALREGEGRISATLVRRVEQQARRLLAGCSAGRTGALQFALVGYLPGDGCAGVLTFHVLADLQCSHLSLCARGALVHDVCIYVGAQIRHVELQTVWRLLCSNHCRGAKQKKSDDPYHFHFGSSMLSA